MSGRYTYLELVQLAELYDSLPKYKRDEYAGWMIRELLATGASVKDMRNHLASSVKSWLEVNENEQDKKRERDSLDNKCTCDD